MHSALQPGLSEIRGRLSDAISRFAAEVRISVRLTVSVARPTSQGIRRQQFVILKYEIVGWLKVIPSSAAISDALHLSNWRCRFGASPVKPTFFRVGYMAETCRHVFAPSPGGWDGRH